MAHIENLPFTLGFVANKSNVVSRHLAKTLGALKVSPILHRREPVLTRILDVVCDGQDEV
jgi:hypothetical protein